jgi:hypothetical protein
MQGVRPRCWNGETQTLETSGVSYRPWIVIQSHAKAYIHHLCSAASKTLSLNTHLR